MIKQARIGTPIIISLYASGLLGALNNDPLEQIGIIAMLLSGLGTGYMITRLTIGLKLTNRLSAIMASLICLLIVFRILTWPFPTILLLSFICMVGFTGQIVTSSINIIFSKKINKSDAYLIFAATSIIILLIDSIFHLEMTSGTVVRIVIFLFLLISGGWLLSGTHTPVKNYPATLVIFIYALFNLIAFVAFRVVE